MGADNSVRRPLAGPESLHSTQGIAHALTQVAAIPLRYGGLPMAGLWKVVIYAWQPFHFWNIPLNFLWAEICAAIHTLHLLCAMLA